VITDRAVVHLQYQPDAHILTADVVLVNKGDKVQRGSLSLLAVGVHSDFGVP